MQVFLFILDDLWKILLDVAVTFGLLLIVLGVLQALLWKLAFYINLAIGLIVTIFLTYVTSTVAGAISATIGLPFNPTFVVFFALLILTLLVAFLGAILAVLEGFAWTFLGILIVSLPSTNSLPQSVLLAAVGGAILVGIATYIGSYLDVWILRSLPVLGRKISRGEYVKKEIEVSRERILEGDIYDVIGDLAKLRAKLSTGEITSSQFEKDSKRIFTALEHGRERILKQLDVIEKELNTIPFAKESSELEMPAYRNLKLFEEVARSMDKNDLIANVRLQEFYLQKLESNYTKKLEQIRTIRDTTKEKIQKRLKILRDLL